MRILIVLHQFYPEFSGGTERVTLNLAHCAQRAGHYVRILACGVNTDAANGADWDSPAGLSETVHEGIPVTLLPRDLLPASADFSLDVEAALVAPIANWMKRERFDVCHVMHTMRMSTAVLAAWPEAKASAAAPPSSAARRFSSTSLVGFISRE